MTIGIAVSGKGAGLAAFRALAAVEKVARGAIGGFVSFVVLDRHGEIQRAETQRGGTSTLFTQGETTGVMPPDIFASAPFAALMSSGPDRPSPLAQFTPAHVNTGLITGHRLPNVPLGNRPAPNLALMEQLKQHHHAQHALDAVLSVYHDADAGLIAMDFQGRIAIGNTALTAQRPDLGIALISEESGSVGILHNAILPSTGLAEFAASVAMDSLAPADAQDFSVFFNSPASLTLGTKNAAFVDQEGRITQIQVTEPHWLGEQFQGAALNFDAAIYQGERLLGHSVGEPYCIASSGQVVLMSGSEQVEIGARTVR